MAANPTPRERKPSTSAPLADLKGPIGPAFSRPKHKRTVTGFGPSEIKSVEASIPEPQREAWRKYVSQLPPSDAAFCECCPSSVNILITEQMPKPFSTSEDFTKDTVRHIETTLARSLFNCDESAAYAGTALAFRDRLVLDWNKTQQSQTFADQKRVYCMGARIALYQIIG
jgi:starch phosphorylase